MQILEFNVMNYRIAQEVSLTQCEQLNVLIGKNNSGKSTLLNAIHEFFAVLGKGSLVFLEDSHTTLLGDCHNRKHNTPISFELKGVVASSAIRNIAPSVRDTARRFGIDTTSQRLSFSISIRKIAYPYPFTYISSASFSNSLDVANRRPIFHVEPDLAIHMAEQLSDLQVFRSQIQVLELLKDRLTESQWDSLLYDCRIKDPLDSAQFADFVNLFPEANRSFLRNFLLASIRTRDYFPNLLSTIEHAIDERISKGRSLSSSIEDAPLQCVMSGSKEFLDLVTSLISIVANAKVHYLKDRRKPIGRSEAVQLIELKLNRDGARNVERLQRAVQEVLGVHLDAFLASGQLNDRQAELDVDEFLADLNGAGIREALRLILDVELTSPDVILLEEPEVHLHPSLETSLMQYIKSISRRCQVFMTTHSTNFIDMSEMRNVYLAKKLGSKCDVSLLSPDSVSEQVPVELGIKPSALFLYERIIFVEGVTDELILRTLAATLHRTFNPATTGFITMDGCRNLNYYANETTLRFLRKRNIELIFLIDMDERDASDIEKIRNTLAGNANLHVLKRRELENYLLAPRAICELVSEKIMSHNLEKQKQDPPNVEFIEKILDECAEELKLLTVSKRVTHRVQLEAINEMPKKLDTSTNDAEEAIRKYFSEKSSAFSRAAGDIDQKIKVCLAEVEGDWQTKKFEIVPGDELLDAVFSRCGVRFRKNRDGPRLAKKLEEKEIPDELRRLLFALCDSPRLSDSGGPEFLRR